MTYKNNDIVPAAWGVNGTYLGFNLAYLAEKANQQHYDLYQKMLEVDAIENDENENMAILAKVDAMHEILKDLISPF